MPVYFCSIRWCGDIDLEHYLVGGVLTTRFVDQILQRRFGLHEYPFPAGFYCGFYLVPVVAEERSESDETVHGAEGEYTIFRGTTIVPFRTNTPFEVLLQYTQHMFGFAVPVFKNYAFVRTVQTCVAQCRINAVPGNAFVVSEHGGGIFD